MKKRVLSMLLAVCMLLSVLPMSILAADLVLPETMSVVPSESNNIPAAITLYKASSSGWGGGWGGIWGGGGTTASNSYHLYLPGNVDVSNCFFSWEGGLTTVVGGTAYESGSLPIPAPGETKTYTFTSGTTTKTFEVTTYQGSEAVKPIFIEIDESQGTIAAMNGDRNHETECTGIIFIDGVQYGLPKMKGRGNATWNQAKEKRPYNLTLDKKVNILGIDSEKTKKWSILANIADHSLLRCKVGFDMAHEMGIGQDSASADVWMNGQYLGTYLVTPKTDSFVSKDGYALENDNYKEKPIAEGGDPSFDLEGLNGVQGNWIADYEYNRITVKKIGENLLEGGVETVETLTAATEKIQAYMQEAWDAIRSPDGYNAQGKYYTDYVDVPSWAAMYLIQEYVKNFDVNAGSILFHRDGTTDADKLIAGPLWDLDNAMGRTSNNGHLGTVVDQMGGYGWYIRDIADDKTSIFKTLGQHEDFMEEVVRAYNKYRPVFENAVATLDSLAEELSASAEMNFKRVTKETYNNANVSRVTTKNAGTEYEQVYKVTSTWQDYVDNLRTFMSARSLFFANNLTRELDAYEATFKCGTNATVTTFDTQDVTGEGHPNATSAFARNSETGEIDISGEGQVNFKVNVSGDYSVSNVTVEPAENYNNLKDLGDGLYRITKITGPIIVTVETSEFVCEHDFVDGVCANCGKAAFRVDIECDDHCSVTVFNTQDLTTGGEENAKVAYARNSSTGAIDLSGDGQMNFIVNVDEGYKVGTITAEPVNYKNLKGPADTGTENGYRMTKITGSMTLKVTTKSAVCDHNYEAVVTRPTCTEAGYTTYTCSECGDSYVVDEIIGTKVDFDISITCPDEFAAGTAPQVIKTTYYSTTCKRDKNVNIQLPANYSEDKSYPVLYLLHGVFGSENDMVSYGSIIEKLIAAGKAEEMIVVYPNMWSSETESSPGFSITHESMAAYDNFVNDLVNDLMPFIAENYSVKEGRENTAVAGFSMGGRESLAIVFSHPELFGFVGAFSPAPGLVPGQDSYLDHKGTFQEDEIKFENEVPYMLMLCSGDNDQVVGTFPQQYHELFDKNGVAHTWWIIPGSGHGDPATSSGVYNFACNVFKAETGSASAEPLGHAWDKGVVTVKPTTTTEGVRTYSCTRCDATYTEPIEKLQNASLITIDFTDPASADRFEVVNQDATSIREGEGLYLVSTKDAMENCNGQLSGTAATTPKDLVKIPVEGDWTATMKFNFDQGGSRGWYEFFGFYVMDENENLVGIRGGDGGMQDFIRVDGAITKETMSSSSGLKSASTHWFRIEKSGEDYTCYWSTDGETFNKLFSYEATGIDGNYLVIDAYSGMATGYNYLVEYIDFEPLDAPVKVKPRLASVSVNGVPLADFDPDTFIYNYEVAKTDDVERVLTAVAADESIDVNVEQIPNGKFGTAVITASNGLSSAKYTFSFNYGPEDDYFADGDMSDNWTILNEVKDPTAERPWCYYRFEEGTGLVMPTQKGSIYMAKQADPQGPWTNVFLMPAQGDWEIVTKSFYPQLPKDIYQQTQVFAWQDEDHYIRINCQYNAQRNLRVEPANEVGSGRFDILDVTYATANDDNTATLYYKINKTGNTYTVSYSTDCKNWVAGGSVDNLNYIDPKFGLFVTQDDGNDNYIELSFEYVAVTSRNGEVLKTDEQVLAWAAQNAANYMAAGLPGTASEQLTVKAPHGYTVEFVSSNPDVIAADGTVTAANDDTTVEVAVKVTEGSTTATSETVTITVPGTHEVEEPEELAIVTEPESFVGKVGETATFAVEVNRTDVTYQWYFSNNGGKSWSVSTLAGCDTASMEIVMKAYRVGQMYKVVVTDSEGNWVESAVVSMKTASELKIVENPVDYKGAVNSTATFTVKAEGEGLTYQWLYSNNGGASWVKSGLGGYNTDTINVQLKAFRNGQMYKCVVTDANGNVLESTAASLNIG